MSRCLQRTLHLRVLQDKQKELGAAADKLRNGLSPLEYEFGWAVWSAALVTSSLFLFPGEFLLILCSKQLKRVSIFPHWRVWDSGTAKFQANHSTHACSHTDTYTLIFLYIYDNYIYTYTYTCVYMFIYCNP